MLAAIADNRRSGRRQDIKPPQIAEVTGYHSLDQDAWA
jgi:hypothetical protein